MLQIPKYLKTLGQDVSGHSLGFIFDLTMFKTFWQQTNPGDMPPLSRLLGRWTHAQDSRDQSSLQVLYSKVIHIYNNHKVTRETVLQGGRKSTHAIFTFHTLSRVRVRISTNGKGIQNSVLRKQTVKIHRGRSREKTHKEAGAGVLTN